MAIDLRNRSRLRSRFSRYRAFASTLATAVATPLGSLASPISIAAAAPAHPVAHQVQAVVSGSQANVQVGRAVSTVGDVNGDGYDDFIVGSPGGGRAFVYFGGPIVNATPDVILNAPGIFCCSGFGGAVASAGDVNGDGHADFIVGAGGYHTGDGAAYVYFGRPGLDSIPDVSLFGPADHIVTFGSAVAGVGDLNHDGFDDLVIGGPQGNLPPGSNAGHVYVYGGRSSGLSDFGQADGQIGDDLGTSVAAAGDVNGDGVDDFIIGAPQAHQPGVGTGYARIYFGNTTGLPFSSLNLNGSGVDDQFGYSVSGAGDMNGDGYADVIVGAPRNDAGGFDAGRAYIYFGGTNPNAIADVLITGAEDSGRLGSAVARAGDVNRDGYSDVIVGAGGDNLGGLPGSAFVYFGGPAPVGIADATFSGGGPNNAFGMAVATAGDVTGDGFSDVIVGAPFGGNYAGRAYLIGFARYFVITPNGGETWTANESQTVSWLGAEPADLFISLDDGATESQLAGGVGSLDSNVVAVVVPDALTNAARIRVAPTDASVSGSDRSDAAFAIHGALGVSDGVIGFRFRSPSPNPARGEVRLSVELERAVDVTATVHDVSGREVARPIAHERLSGRVVRTWTPSDLASGLYFVRARLGNREQVRRLVWLPAH